MYSSIQHVQTAIQALRKVATKGKTKKSILESIDNVSSTTVLLNSSAPSVHAFDKLETMLRKPLIPLYMNYTEQSLNFASAVLKVLLNDGVRPCLMEGDDRDVGRQAGWERVAVSLISGIMDFLDKQDSESSKTSIAKALFAPICNFFFSKDLHANAEIGAPLRCTAYSLLCDAATLQEDNRSKLRDKKLLGGRTLGIVISKTRDFYALEGLLNLFGVIRPTHQKSKEEHNAFVQDVFSDQIDMFSNCRKNIVELLASVSNQDWDATATKIVDILSASNINFPQQFDVNEVIICGNKYPQPELSDKFYIDKNSFAVNIQQDDGLYEYLQITYDNVLEMSFESAKERTTSILLTLKTTPSIGEFTFPVKDSQNTLLVELLNNDIPRFKKALQHRHLHCTIPGTQKLSKAAPRVSVSGSAFLDFDEDDMQWGDVSLIHSQKAKEVESFYESEPLQVPTSDEEDDANEEPISVPKESSNLSSATRPRKSDDPKLPSPKAQLNINVFGEADSELSDIDDVKNMDTFKVNADALEAGNNTSTARSTMKKPTEVISLSDCESLVEVKPPSRGGKGGRKGAQRRVESDEEFANEEPAAENSAPKKASSSGIRSKPTMQKKTEKNQELDSDVKPRRPRRAAAKTASAKLATALIDSEDINTSAIPQAVSPLHNKKPDADPFVEAAEATKIPKKAGQAPEAARSTKATVDLETIAPRSSSPTSKISRMKTKNAPAETKPSKKKAQKRKAEEAIVLDEFLEQPNKRTRNDIEGALQDKITNENDIDADLPHTDVSAPPPQRYGHRGRKGKASPAQQKSSIDWDLVPSEALGVDQTRQAAISPSKKTSPVKVTAKKENAGKSKNVSKMALNPDKSESKLRPRARAPLQTITQTPNQASTESKSNDFKQKDIIPASTALNKKLKDHKSTKMVSTKDKAKQKESSLPSLEDILLKGANVEMIEVEQTEIIEAEADIMNYDDGNMNDEHFGNMEGDQIMLPMDVDDTPYTTELTIHERPQTPPQEKPPQELPSSPRVSKSKHPKKTFDLDSDLMDLTDDDVKEVLQTLRARRAKGKLEFGKAPLLEDPAQEILATNIGRESSPVESNKVQELQKMLSVSRPKVKFNEELRFKSASLETLSDQEPVAFHHTVEGKKPRLSGSRLTARGLGPIEIASRSKKQESQIRKEPGMEEIVNVLDAIQNVITSNIANKSRAVRGDIRIARDCLIHEAVADLHEMREESIGHYNNLFSLESEYANINRRLNIGFEAVSNVNTDICNFVRQTVNTHDRGSLSKKMPQTLFSSAMPQSFSKFL